ncbi:MAG: DNA topoisomerase 3 [Eubacteriales bacterium]|nr:DNA topoisomerase 3 [Eubacteriales bacterium]
MIVVIAEKPSVARDIARVLKCKEKGEAYYFNDKYTVSWALGHLVALCEPQEIDEKYKRWRKEDLPIIPEKIPTKVIPKTRKQYNVLKKLLSDANTSSVICATDAGREGELIFRLIYEKTGCKKPVDRLWISSMTDTALKEGFAALTPSSKYDNLYKSARLRAQADWLVGMNATRAFTLRYGVLLSLGRVQTPTLSILVKRKEEIANFVKEEYYTVQVDYGDFTGTWFDIDSEDDRVSQRIKDQATAKAIVKKVSGKEAETISLTKENKRELPPLLYDLTSLQRDANKMLGFTAKKTLSLAQSLYESKKYITYPRTDSKYLSDDMLPVVNKTIDALPKEYSTLVKGLNMQSGSVKKDKRVFDASKVTDHHAIIPTNTSAKLDKLSPDEAALFDIIIRRFLAVFYPPYEYESVKAILHCEGENFKSIGKNIINLGWKATNKNPSKETVLPELSKGDKRKIISSRSKREEAKPPQNHTDASLLAGMENAGKIIEDEALREQMKGSGIGTPATRAAIIERLIQVKYVKRQGKFLLATDKGERIIKAAPEAITSPEMTGRWEKALSEIAEGKQDGKRFWQGIQNLTNYLIDYTNKDAPQLEFEREVKGKSSKTKKTNAVEGVMCPVCASQMQENSKAFYCDRWKDGCRFTLWKNCLQNAGGPLLNKKIITMLFKEGQVVGSTGTIKINEKEITFTKKGEEKPAVSISMLYQRKG